MKRSLLFPLFLACAAVVQAGEDPFAKLASSLVEQLPQKDKPINLGVGNFVYGDTQMMSPLSTTIREELEIALPKSHKVQIITRSGLDELETEGEFQATDLVEPGTAVSKVAVQGVEGIVRGRFTSDGSTVTLYTEIAWLESGRVTKDKVTWRINEVAARVWPSKSASEAAARVMPQNFEQSKQGIAEVEAGAEEVTNNAKLLNVKQEIPLQLRTVDGERVYQEGDTIAFRVKAAETCHIVVICHQSDGTSVVLFPNQFHKDTLIEGGKWVDIPGTLKSGFEIEIGEPFGSDVVQVIACTNENALHKEIKDLAAATTKDDPYPVMTRGMSIKKAKAASKADLSNQTKWGEKHIIVSTFPKE